MRLACLGIILVDLIAGSLAAQDPVERVVVSADQAELKHGKDVVGTVSKGDVLVVNQTNGDWLWVQQEDNGKVVKGWLKRSSVQTQQEYLDSLSELIRSQPTAATYEKRGMFYTKLGDYSRAAADLTEAIDIEATALRYYYRGLAYRRDDDLEGAIADFTAGSQLSPADPDFYNQRGICHFELGNFDAAIVDYTAATLVAPNAALLYNNRANAWYKKKQMGMAIVDYNNATRLDPADSMSYRNRAVVLNEVGRYREAHSDYKRAYDLAPKDPLALNGLAWFLATCEDKSFRDSERAVALAKEACELTQWHNWIPIDTLATATAAAGDVEKAITLQEQAIQIGPESAQQEMAGRLDEFKTRFKLLAVNDASTTPAPADAPLALSTTRPDNSRSSPPASERPANSLAEAVDQPDDDGGPNAPAKKNDGTLWIGKTRYALKNVIAYKSKVFDDDPNLFTVVLATEMPVPQTNLNNLKQSLEKDGTDNGFSFFTPHVKLTFDPDGGLMFFNGWADNKSLNGGSGVDAEIREKNGAVVGKAVMTEEKQFFDEIYRFDVRFDVKLLSFNVANATLLADSRRPEKAAPNQAAGISANDIPTPEGATDIERDADLEMVVFRSKLRASQIGAFYEKELGKLQWTKNKTESFVDDDLGVGGVAFGTGEQFLRVVIQDGQPGSKSRVLITGDGIIWTGPSDAPAAELGGALAAEAAVGPEPAPREFSAQAIHLPFPPDAHKLEFDATFEDIEFVSGSSLESLAVFYRAQMAARGWEEDPSGAPNSDDEIGMTFKHGAAEVVLELAETSDGEVDVALDCEGLTWQGVNDPAALAALGVPQPRSHLFLQKDVPRPEGFFDLEFDDDACEFKSKLAPGDAADFFIRELQQRGWKPGDSRPFLTENLCTLEYAQGGVTLDFTIFRNQNPAGSRIKIGYKNETPEPAIPPLGAIARIKPSPDAATDPSPAPSASPATAAPVDFSTTKGSATVTYGGKKQIFQHAVAYQAPVYGDDRVVVLFSNRTIPFEKLQLSLNADEDFSFSDLYRYSSPDTFSLFLYKGNMSISYSASGVGIGGHSSDYASHDATVEKGRIAGTFKMTKAEEILSEQFQFEAAIDAPILRPGSWPPLDSLELQADRLTDEHGPLVPDNATEVVTSRSLYRRSATAVVPMTLPQVLALYRDEMATAGWIENEDARVISPDEFTVVFEQQGNSTIVTLNRADPNTRLAAALRRDSDAKEDGLLPETGKARFILGNASESEATVEFGSTSYTAKPGRGAESPKDAVSATVDPGKYDVTIRVLGEDPQKESVDIKAGTTWGIIINPMRGYAIIQLY